MKVFISWSGEKSQGYAAVVKRWLNFMFSDVNAWMSSVDIASGQDWNEQLTTELGKSSFGIICITPENQDSPWINFEAGAISNHVQASDTRVAPLLFGFSKAGDFSGPLKKYQASLADRKGLRKLAQDINAILPTARSSELLDDLMNKLWDDIEAGFKKVELSYGDMKAPRRTQDEILEEVLNVVRGVDARLTAPGVPIHARDPHSIPFSTAFSDLVRVTLGPGPYLTHGWYTRSGGNSGSIVSATKLPEAAKQQISIITQAVLQGTVSFEVDPDEVERAERDYERWDALKEQYEREEAERSEILAASEEGDH